MSADQQYPGGTGPEHISFSALSADDTNVSHTPREYWGSYAILYTAPPERPLVEGNYYINATTGEIIADRWDRARVYRRGKTHAYAQPAGRNLTEHRRAQFESDDAFVYDNATSASYRYDLQYGRVAPTNIGRHTDILERYTWEAVNTTTHHGVPVIIYQTTGKRPDTAREPPAASGTLQIGVEDGIVYAFDITVDDGTETYRYTSDVRPAPFPDHDWVDTARDVAAGNAVDNRSERQRLVARHLLASHAAHPATRRYRAA